jgi:acyl-CoA dehydrogenase
VNFDYTPKVRELQARLVAFMDAHIYPNEHRFREEVEANRARGNAWIPTKLVEELKPKARAAGLWNLFLPDSPEGAGLTNLEYAPLAEIMGRVTWAPEVFNCSAPDTGNMETIERYGTEDQKRQWLEPLLRGEIRSAFLMTEPAVASSDATNIECSMVREGEEYVVNGRKWWSSGAGDPRCNLYIVMGKTDPNAPRHRQQSMLLVPATAPGVRVLRPLTVLMSTTRRTDTWRSTWRMCACRCRTCSRPRVAASRSRREGSGRVASTIACVSSASPSARSS